MKTARPTLSDIAKKFGISKQAVSRALRDMPDISIQTRKAVQAYSREIGYSMNWAAKSLATQTSGLIGIGMGSFTNPFFQEVTYALSRSIKQAGFIPVLVDVEATIKGLSGTSQSFAPEMPLDGLILLEGWYDMHLTEKQISLLDSNVAPTLYRGNLMSRIVDQVQVDWYSASRVLTRHLIENGHRRIAAIRGTGGSSSIPEAFVPDKIRGMMDEMAGHGIDYDADLVIRISTHLSFSRDATADLISRPNPPTAIICHTDYLAVGAIRAVKEKGLSVPDDISIAGFNHIEIGAYLPTSLTTIGHDRTNLAQELVDRLINRVKEGRAPECFPTQVRHELVVGESTGPR